MSQAQLFTLHALELGPMENFIYLIHDQASGRAAVVDPAWDVPQVLALAQRKGMHITDILLTHSHHDHINGIQAVLDKHNCTCSGRKRASGGMAWTCPPCIMAATSSIWAQLRSASCIHRGIRPVRPVTGSATT
jgi:glyoxylase-like metal-dependent hydrolase (beta-lactamase superfamily II)